MVSRAIELRLNALRQHQIVLLYKPYDTEFFHYARLVYGVRLLGALELCTGTVVLAENLGLKRLWGRMLGD